MGDDYAWLDGGHQRASSGETPTSEDALQSARARRFGAVREMLDERVRPGEDHSHMAVIRPAHDEGRTPVRSADLEDLPVTARLTIL